MTGRRRALAIANVATLFLGLVAAVTVGSPSRGERARSALRQARAFAHHAKTVHFSATARYEFAAPGSDFRSTSYVVRLTSEGEIEFPDRFRILVQIGEFGTSETIAVGKKLFQREGDNSSDLLGQKWVDLGGVIARAPETLGGSAQSASNFEMLPAIVRPSELLAVVRAANSPRLVRRRAAVTTVRARVGLGHFHTESKTVTQADTEVSVRDGGSIERVTVRFIGRSLRGTVSYDFRLWHKPVVIAAPSGSQVDLTPGINEEAIAAFKDVPKLQPHGIPAGWVMTEAEVLPPDESDESCSELEIDYSDPKDEDAGYLYLYEFAPTCANTQPPHGATPFAAGAAHGWIQDDGDERVVEILVGATMVKVESDLTGPQLATILSALVPLTLEKPPPPLAGIATPRPTE